MLKNDTLQGSTYLLYIAYIWEYPPPPPHQDYFIAAAYGHKDLYGKTIGGQELKTQTSFQ